MPTIGQPLKVGDERECVCVHKCGPFVFFALCARCIYRFKWPLEKEPFICIAAATTTTAAAATAVVVNIDEHGIVYEGEKIPQFSWAAFFLCVLIVTHSRFVKTVKQRPSKVPRQRGKNTAATVIIGQHQLAMQFLHNRIMVAAMVWCVSGGHVPSFLFLLSSEC